MADPEEAEAETDETASPTPAEAAEEEEDPNQDEIEKKADMERQAPLVGLGDITKMKEMLFSVQDGRAIPVWIETGISSETNIEIQGEQVTDGMEIVCGSFKVLNRELKPRDAVEPAEGGSGRPQ